MGDKRRRLPRPWRVVLLLLGMMALWLVGDLAYVVIGAESDYAAPADVIILLGCNPYGPQGGPSVCLSARSQHAADLYHEGLAEHIIASGGYVENGPTEASVML
ncbi:MAG: hypothetical protein QOH93_1770, partial [Chloroflexia bacterium]|nr:hypothetical protein [Chloroflexia bacterium]